MRPDAGLEAMGTEIADPRSGYVPRYSGLGNGSPRRDIAGFREVLRKNNQAFTQAGFRPKRGDGEDP